SPTARGPPRGVGPTRSSRPAARPPPGARRGARTATPHRGMGRARVSSAAATRAKVLLLPPRRTRTAPASRSPPTIGRIGPSPLARTSGATPMADRFYSPEAAAGGRLVLEGDEARHLSRVRRLGAGDVVELFDGRGHATLARVVVVVGRDRVELE